MEEFKAKSNVELSGMSTVRDYNFDMDDSQYSKVGNETLEDRTANYDDLIYSKFNNTDYPPEEDKDNHTGS